MLRQYRLAQESFIVKSIATHRGDFRHKGESSWPPYLLLRLFLKFRDALGFASQMGRWPSYEPARRFPQAAK